MKPTPILLITALALLLASCGSLQSFEKRKYMKGFHVEFANNNLQSELLNNKPQEKENIKPEPAIKKEIAFEKTEINTLPEQKDTASVLIISDKVGDVIDSAEKAQYKLFPFWRKEEFVSAQFIQKDDGRIFLIGKMKDGSTKIIPYTLQQYYETAKYTFGEVPENVKQIEQQKQENKAINEEIENETTRLVLALVLGALLFAIVIWFRNGGSLI